MQRWLSFRNRLERASKFVKVLEFGTTPEGRTMIAMVVSKNRAFTPAAAAKTSKAVNSDPERNSFRRNRSKGHRNYARPRHGREQAVRLLA